MGSRGVTFTLPKDWSSKSGPGWLDALPPKGDADIVIVNADAVTNGAEAAAKAWALFRAIMGRRNLGRLRGLAGRTPRGYSHRLAQGQPLDSGPHRRQCIHR